MTGPAQFARFITVVGAVGVLGVPVWSHAAAPRDAIKTLPTVSHSSEFNLISPDQGTFNDNYHGLWRIDWTSPEVQIGVAKARLDLHYQHDLTDFINRIDGSSSSGRSDDLTASAVINTLRGVKLSYSFQQVDTYSGRSSEPGVRSYNPRSLTTARLDWVLPNLPELHATYRLTRTYSYYGQALGSRSESSVLNANLRYRYENPVASQEYKAMVEHTEARTYAAQVTGSSTNKFVIEGSRSIPLGKLGEMTAGAYYEETTTRGDNDFLPRRTSQSNVSLRLGGAVFNFPLQYDVGLSSGATGYESAPGEQVNSGVLSLLFTPSVPPNKSAALRLSQTFEDRQSVNYSTFTDTRVAKWDFRINPRMTNSVRYELVSIVDNLLNQSNQENEGLSASMTYEIPGSQSNLTTSYNQSITRQPTSGDRRMGHGINLASNFRLGTSATVGLIYNHNYDENTAGPLAALRRTEYVTSGVNYSLDAGQGLSLSASWRQHFQLNTSDEKRDNQSLNITLTWNTPGRWLYQFQVASNDIHQETTGSATGYTYQSGEEYIRGLISYTF